MRRSELVLAVYVPTALLSFGQGLLLATLPLFAADAFDVSYSVVSFVVSAAALGTLITDVPAGAFLSKIGLRRAMLGGSSLVALSTFLLVFDLPLEVVIALRLASGVGTAVWGLSRHAFIAAAVPVAMRGRAVSVFGGINRIGVLGGPAIGGVLGEVFGLQSAFVASGLMAGAALLLSFLVVKIDAAKASTNTRRTRWTMVGRLFRTNGRDLAAASVAQIFAQMIRSGRQLIIPLYGKEIVGLDTAQIGLVMTLATILDVAMFVPAGVLMDRFGRKVAAVPSFAVMAVGVALIPFATDYAGLILAAMVIGFGNGLGSGTMMTLGADLAPPEAAGEFLGLWRLVGDAGAVGGPLVVGVMAATFGLEGSAYALAVIGAAAALTLALLVRETRQSPLDQPAAA
jgi:MFS family permease